MEKNPTINFDPSNWKSMINLMEKYGDSKAPFAGKNEDGETVSLEIYHDRISVNTFQSNGWVRENVYWEDGTVEELYHGRWNK